MNPRSDRALHGAAYAGMFVFGITMALLGAVLPSLGERLHFPLAASGSLFLSMNCAMLFGSLALGAWMDRHGMRLPLAAGPVLVAVGLALVVQASSFAALLPGMLALGFGGIALNNGTNTLVSDLHDDAATKGAALNRLGIFYGFGALALPMGLGALVSRLGTAPVLLAAAALCVAVGLYSATPKYPAPKAHASAPPTEWLALLRHPLIWCGCAFYFFESGTEFVLGGYMTTFLTREIHMSIPAASWILAGYWASLMLARVALARILKHVTASTVVLCCALLAALGVALAAVAPGAVMAAIAIWLAGWALSGIYPTALGILGAAFGARSSVAFGIVIAAGLAGGIVMPWIAAQLADAVGMRAVMWLSAGTFTMVALISLGLRSTSAEPTR
jgi:fucose permease